MQLLFSGKIHLDYLHIDFPNMSSVFMDFEGFQNISKSKMANLSIDTIWWQKKHFIYCTLYNYWAFKLVFVINEKVMRAKE